MTQQTLGSSIMIKNALQWDYNVCESISCLLELCDKVVICDAGSDDGTLAMMWERFGYSQKIDWVFCTPKEWEEQKGSQKLAYFTNKAIAKLDTDWNINLQADECISEHSFPWIRQAINEGKHESYLCKRINLWGDCNHFLDVPQERKPCSDVVLRLAKSKYWSAGDAESLETPECSPKYIDNIRILHYGFVRKKEVMKSKIINMQQGVFGMENYDPKLDSMQVFDSTAWFQGEDLKPLTEPHPKFMKEWVKTRP